MDFKAFKIDPEQLSVPDFYDSPIGLLIDKMSSEIAKQTDEMVYSAVQKVGIDIDKDKLVSALEQDKQRYRDAYTKGYLDAMNRFTEAINRVFAEITEGETPEDL